MTAIVDSVESVLQTWSPPHVVYEVFKRATPLFAYTNSTPSVVFILVCVCVVATCPHRHP